MFRSMEEIRTVDHHPLPSQSNPQWGRDLQSQLVFYKESKFPTHTQRMEEGTEGREEVAAAAPPKYRKRSVYNTQPAHNTAQLPGSAY